MKKLLSLMLATVMLLAVVPGITVYGADIVASGECGAQGNNLTWTLDSDGTLTIRGTGAMKYWYYEESPFYYNSNIKIVIIDKGVTSIGDRAFEDCTSLTNVNIPDSVTYIGDEAFDDCTSLTSVSIPDSVTTIGDYAFFNCTSLTSVSISNRLTIIGDFTFLNCKNLTSVNIPDSVTTIGDYAFSNCKNLASVNIPDSVTTIGDYAFSNCTSLTSVNIPDSVTTIGGLAFEYCMSLTSITIPASITYIGDGTFFYCMNLTSITIPDSVTSVGERAFCSCTNLKNVYYGGTEAQWNKISIGSYNDELLNATIHYNGKSTVDSDKYVSDIRPHIWLNANGIYATYLGIGQSYNSGLQVYPSDAYPKSVVWHSANPQIASVSQNGLITGVSEGTTSVYVTTPYGITSDALTVVVTDLSRFEKSITATDKVNQIGYGSNYQWINNNNNFLYWQAFLSNDSSAMKYWFQNYVCAPLFESSEIKNLYSGECSVKRAKEILLSFISDTYEPTFNTVKKDFSYKLGKKAASTLGEFLDDKIDKNYGARLDALGEKNIIAAFDNGYENGINALANYFEPNDPEKFTSLVRQWLAADTVSECFSALSKIIDLRNTVSSIGNELIEVQLAAQTNNGYCEMLDYLAENCISSNVRRAAIEIKNEMNSSLMQNLAALSASLAVSKFQDKVIDRVSKKTFEAIFGTDFIVKLGYDMGIFVSNELLHASDYLACSDNVRLLSYISVSMTTNISDIYSKFLHEQNPVIKEEYAQKLIEQYNILISARKLGEENYYKTYQYNPVNLVEIMKLFGVGDMKYEQWYEDTMNWLDAAKNYPEKPKPTRQGGFYEDPSTTYTMSIDSYESMLMSSGKPYTKAEFYTLFKDKDFADAVLYSLGTSAENTDWSMVTDETVENLTVLLCNSEGAIDDLTGISNLPSLEYIDLSNQCVRNIPEEITELSNLQAINLFNNGITKYPDILNNVPSLNIVSLAYNLLTELPTTVVPELDVRGNLLDMNEYGEPRYLYSANPIISSANDNLSTIITVKDMYGTEYAYNGNGLYVDGVALENATFSGYSAVISVNNSENPNARLSVAVNICSDEAYTEEVFINAFPDEQLRIAVLSELGMEEEVDYSKITPAELSKIWSLETSEVSDFTGIELLKGLNSLEAANSYISTLPNEILQLKNLQYLSLYGSEIENINNIYLLDALVELDISECHNLKNLLAVGDIEKLDALYANGLGMSDILEQIFDISRLSKLSVRGNCIEDITMLIGNDFDYLDISGNYIDENALETEYVPALAQSCKSLVYAPQISSLVKNVAVDGTKVTVALENTTGAIYNDITLAVASYDGGAMKGCVTQKFSLDIDEVKTVEVELKNTTEDIRCFVWDDVKTMTPLSREYSK